MNESNDTFDGGESPNRMVSDLKSRLEQEFSYEITLLAGNRNLTANIESIYTRAVSILSLIHISIAQWTAKAVSVCRKWALCW